MQKMLVQVLFIHVHLEMDNICIKTWIIGSQKNWCLVVSEERNADAEEAVISVTIFL